MTHIAMLPWQVLLGILLVGLFGAEESFAQRLTVSPDRFEFTIDADQVVTGGASIRIVASASNIPFQENLPFRANASITQLPANGPRFLIVSPANGTTPANGALALDPQVVPFLAPGVYAATFSYSVGSSGSPPAAGGFFNLRIRTPPPPVIDAVLNGATLKPSIAPGALVSIFGTHLGSPALAAHFDEFGMYPTTFGNSTVTFNGVAAPMTYVGNSQINAIVPYDLAGQTPVRVVVKHHGQLSAEFTIPVSDTAPGIFTASQTGNGQGAILQTKKGDNLSVSVNNAANPVERGAAITCFATGSGLWNQDVRAGQVLFSPTGDPPIRPRLPVSFTIGGVPAVILYAGAAPNMAGVLQVNALVPESVPPGSQVVDLRVGELNNSLQQQVTVAVQ